MFVNTTKLIMFIKISRKQSWPQSRESREIIDETETRNMAPRRDQSRGLESRLQALVSTLGHMNKRQVLCKVSFQPQSSKLVPAAEIRDHETGLVLGPFSWFQSRQIFHETHETEEPFINLQNSLLYRVSHPRFCN